MIERTAIVTGASRRVGAEIVRALLEDGWTVLAHVHHAQDEVPAGAIKGVADLTEPDCARTIFGAVSSLPPVRLLVNNAARFSFDSIGDFACAEFDGHMAVNVRAPALLIAELARRHRGGDALVVNLLDSKLSGLNPDFLSYTLSKQALSGLTELCARALAGNGIRVNAIAPGLMLPSTGQSEENFRMMHANNPLHRGVEISDVVGALRYFIAAGGVTGQIMTIDSGQRFLGLERDVQFLDRE
jgi:NAD(P)-dependent dehydrogenase (short-subunit alcohol dehydrogenase family)